MHGSLSLALFSSVTDSDLSDTAAKYGIHAIAIVEEEKTQLEEVIKVILSCTGRIPVFLIDTVKRLAVSHLALVLEMIVE